MPTCRPKIAETRHELGMVAAKCKKEKQKPTESKADMRRHKYCTEGHPRGGKRKKRDVNESHAEDGFLFS